MPDLSPVALRLLVEVGPIVVLVAHQVYELVEFLLVLLTRLARLLRVA